MKRNGNINSNRTYNPQNARPHIPLDVDEVDATLERFIRQKYDQQAFSSGAVRPAVRNDTGSTRSSEDQPPPLPPKPARRFGFGLRAVSSTLPLSRSSQISPPESPNGNNGYGQPPSPIRVNKQSRIFGASVGGIAGENMDSKLATLRDMGFPDEKRNANILKGLGGNLERAIESLVRLGEGNAPALVSRTPLSAGNDAVSQPLNLGLNTSRTVPQTTATQPTANPPAPHTQGNLQTEVSNQKTHQPGHQASQVLNPLNPFQPQSYNPLETSNPQSAIYPLERAFESMQVSQPLFPNATGGYPSQQQQMQDARLQQSMTPPVPQPPHHYYQSHPYLQPAQVPTSSYNPFYLNEQQVALNSSISYPIIGQEQTAAVSYNPFLHSPSLVQSPIYDYPIQTPQTYPHEQQPPQQSQQPLPPHLPQQPQQQQPPFGYNTSFQGQQPSGPYMPLQQPAIDLNKPQFQRFQTPNQPPPQLSQPQQTERFDKSSILALYNYPQLAPPPLAANPYEPISSAPPLTAGQSSASPAIQQQRSFTTPAALTSGSKNPFHTAVSDLHAEAEHPVVNGAGISKHVSQDSVDIGGFQNGRHSPDAFASLSARIVR